MRLLIYAECKFGVLPKIKKSKVRTLINTVSVCVFLIPNDDVRQIATFYRLKLNTRWFKYKLVVTRNNKI